jgi:hypothetical protein
VAARGITRNVLQYDIDKPSFQRAYEATERFREMIRDTATEAKKFGVGAVQISADIRKAFDSRSLTSFRGEIKSATSDFEKLRQSILSSAKAKEELDSAGGRGFGSGQINVLGQVAGVVSPQAGAIVRDIGDLQRAKEEFGGIGTVIAAGGVIATAAALAFQQMNKDLEDVRNQVQATAQANRDYYAAINQGQTTEETQKKIEELTAARDAEAASLADQKAATDAAFVDAQRAYGDAAARILFAIGNIGTNSAETEKNITNYNAQIEAQQRLLQDGALVANDAAAAEEKLLQAREQAIPRLEALANQAAELVRRNGQQTAEITQDRLKRDLREEDAYARQRERQETQLRDRLKQIGAQGAESLARIREQGIKRLQSIDADLGNLANQKSGLQDKYMQSELKAAQKFADDEAKIKKQGNKELLRLAEDLRDNLFDATIKNDVIAFNAAKRAGLKELSRRSEDMDEATQERVGQFLAEREAAQEAHNEALANIDAEIAAKQQARVTIEAENKAQFEAEQARIKATADAAKAAAEEQQRIQDEDRNIRLQQQEEDDRTADQRRENALNQALADIDRKAQAEAAAIGVVGQSLNQLISAVKNGTASAIAGILSASRLTGSSRPTSSSSSSAPPPRQSILGPVKTGNRPGVYAFGEGSRNRMIDQPTIGLLGERPGWGDMVTSFPLHGGRPAPGMGNSFSIQIYQTIGDIASKADAKEIAMDTEVRVKKAVLNLLSSARQP